MIKYLANDIGVAQISGKIEFNDIVKAIEYSPDEVPDGAKLQLTGWGEFAFLKSFLCAQF